MNQIPRETLEAYLDDALSEVEIAQVEQCLRADAAMLGRLRALMQDRDRGEHSVGAIWRRHRLTCLSRDQLGSYLLGALERDLHDYARFHLRTIGCAFCLANLADIEDQSQEAKPQVQARRRRVLQSSAGLLRKKKP